MRPASPSARISRRSRLHPYLHCLSCSIALMRTHGMCLEKEATMVCIPLGYWLARNVLRHQEVALFARHIFQADLDDGWPIWKHLECTAICSRQCLICHYKSMLAPQARPGLLAQTLCMRTAPLNLTRSGPVALDGLFPLESRRARGQRH